MTDQRDIIQSLWVGPTLSRMEQLCLRSFLHHGHRFQLYVYDEPENVPPGVELCDANTVLDRSRVFRYKEHATYAGFANFFRYRMLLEKGGWWVDMDTVCIAPFDFPEPVVISSEGINGNRHVNVGMVRMPPNSEAMRFAWSECEKMNTAELRWSQCGPQLMARIVEQCSLHSFVMPPDTFCPIHFSEWHKLVEPNREWSFGPQTRAIHLWHELWRRESQDKDAQYPSTCLYEILKRRYL